MDHDTPTRPAEASEGSPGVDEAQGQSSSKYPAVKDRKCQYCHQAFTSSSLGRHLDQFLFKKKPDGVHDVEEIRRIRSGITRRQARTSTSKRDSPERPAGKGHADSSHGTNEANAGSRPREGPKMMFNTPTWHATGVINDIPNPSRTRDTPGPGRRSASHSASGSLSVPDYASRGASATNPDTMRALELALREVLDNIKAATSTKLRPRVSPFELDIQAQTFPSLCLQLLPAPPTLFTLQPFASPTSFPLNPPGLEHLEIVRRALRSKILQWHSDQLVIDPSESSRFRQAHGVALDSSMIDRSAQQHEEISSRHLDLSFNHWMSLPLDVRRDQWQLEITRAYVRETEKRKSLDEQLDRVQQEANQLRTQVVKLGSCQWPREFALFPPDFLPLPREVAKELDSRAGSNSPDSPRWDYDNLVAKWRRVVMHDKGMGRVGIGQSVVPEDHGSDNAALRAGFDTTNVNPTASTASNRTKKLQPAAAVSPEQSNQYANVARTPCERCGGGHSQSSCVKYSSAQTAAPSNANTQSPSSNSQSMSYHDAHASPRTGPPAKRARLTNGHSGQSNDGESNKPPVNMNTDTSTGQNPTGTGMSNSWNSHQAMLSNTAPQSSARQPPET